MDHYAVPVHLHIVIDGQQFCVKFPNPDNVQPRATGVISELSSCATQPACLPGGSKSLSWNLKSTRKEYHMKELPCEMRSNTDLQIQQMFCTELQSGHGI